MDIAAILEATVSQDKAVLEQAQQALEQAATKLPEFLRALAAVLHDVSKSANARVAAGLQLKNYLTAKDAARNLQYQERWFSMDVADRTAIKSLVLGALGTEVHRPSSAAQCVAGIASAELPQNQWPELIVTLMSNATGPQSSTPLKVATFEALGYICQDIDPQHLTNYANEILTAIVTGMNAEEPIIEEIRLAAANALLNSLEFTRANFEKESERNYIMTVICQCTQSQDKSVKVTALQCLVKIISLYYEFMESYMGPALFAITVDAMKSMDDDTILQGIEFWSSLCDEEIDLAIELADAQENGTQPEHYSRFYAKGALLHLIPILLLCLTKQEEFDDEDDWIPSKAAGVCLVLLAQCCASDIVAPVLPFVMEHIKNTDWKFRDAAVMALGCILDGPDNDTLTPFVLQAIDPLLQLMNDQSVVVRDTVAWTLGRICEQVPDAVLSNNAILGRVTTSMAASLDSEPRVASNICWAFSSLADSAYDKAQTQDGEDPETYILSSSFGAIARKLLETAERVDGHQSNLRNAAYEAVMELIKNSPKDCYEHVKDTIMALLQKVSVVLQAEQSGGSKVGDHRQHDDFKSLLCAALQSCLRKVTPDDAVQVGDAMMTAFLQMLTMTRVGGVQEDAFMAVGALVEVLNSNFMKYMDSFKPFLLEGLKSKADYQVCIAAVGVVGDLCRALGVSFQSHCDEIMTILVENLADQTVHRSVKPHIISVFGDVALAVGVNFTNYSNVVMSTLQQASMAQVDKNDYDMIEYLNDLRESCLEAYTGIVQGLKGNDLNNVDPAVMSIQSHVAHVITFIKAIAMDQDRSDALVGSCCGLLGDLCSAYKAQLLPLIDDPTLQDMLQEGRRSKVSRTKTVAVWATKSIRSLRN